jgi:hypothetical protein
VSTPAAPGQTVTLSLTLEDGTAAGVFPQATVYNPAGAPLGTVDLTHAAKGRWTGPFALPATTPGGIHKVHYAVYLDAAHTLLDPLHGADEEEFNTDFRAIFDELRANSGGAGSYGQALKVLLGITGKANMRIDKTVYDVNGFLTSARIRIFETSALASAATVDAADGVDGELARVDLTGVADLIHLALPDNVLGLLT